MGESRRIQEGLCSACTCNLENCIQSTCTRDLDILVHCFYTWQRGDMSSVLQSILCLY